MVQNLKQLAIKYIDFIFIIQKRKLKYNPPYIKLHQIDECEGEVNF